MSKIKTFLLDLAIAAAMAVLIVLVLNAAIGMISSVSLTCAEKITAAGMEVA